MRINVSNTQKIISEGTSIKNFNKKYGLISMQ